MSAIKIIAAGAGSGKTYRLTNEMFDLLRAGVRPSGIIATTFTAKAAAELQARVRTKLLEHGMTQAANDLSNALIGTVHGLGVKLLRRFAFEAGVSPQVDIIAEEDQAVLFNRSLAQILTLERTEMMDELSQRLGLLKSPFNKTDWRRIVQDISDVARANNFDRATMHESKKRSFASFEQLLGATNGTTDAPTYFAQLLDTMQTTLDALQQSPDSTKVTKDATDELLQTQRELQRNGQLDWHQLAKLQKLKVGKKSEPLLEDLQVAAAAHSDLTAFRADIEAFTDGVFDLADVAIQEFDTYKRQRGLIDYTDMEVYINRLLDNPAVVAVLREELDLLLVDEFQDTSPIQLELFLKLSNIAKQSIWVGDPKQSIYGFRGAEPRLMQAIVEKVGIRAEDILSDSWRSRPDLVFAANAIFTQAFDHLPAEQVALRPQRHDEKGQTDALIHWKMLDAEQPDKAPLKGSWLDEAVAQSLQKLLQRDRDRIVPKGEKTTRVARAGDVAILCRSNAQCVSMAAALQKVGLKAAIAQTGLLQTAEVSLVVAALRYLLNRQDALAVAEMRVLANAESLKTVVEDRLDFVGDLPDHVYPDASWAIDAPFVQKVNELRRETGELSSTEILNLLLEQLDIRRIVAAWGNAAKRLNNLDKLRNFALRYENACNRFHSAASLGGFLLYLQKLNADEKDQQSSGESPDAVNILTYHRSKGLEYPIVVCQSLGQNARDAVFGLQIVSEREAVRLDDILGGRWLRYWVNPYADQLKNTRLDTQINESEAQKIAHRLALEEEARLLYVGITRARDYLIMPTTRKVESTAWLNRVFHKGKNDEITLLEGNESRFEWQSKSLTQGYEEFFYPKNTAFANAPNAETVYFIETAKGKIEHTPYRIDNENERFQPPLPFVIQDEYGKKIITTDTADTDTAPRPLIKAVHAFFAADRPTYSPTTRHTMANDLLQRLDLGERMTVADLLAQGTAWRRWLVQQFGAAHQLQTRYPVRWHTLRGRLFDATIDNVVEYADGCALIQHNYFIGDARKCRTEAMRQATVLGYARTAWLAANPAASVTCYVHFPMLGVVVMLGE